MSKIHIPTLNWPLWLGLLIVLCIAVAAFFGPALAPRDPLEENRVVKSGERWYTPPFPAFSIAEFPLGSDRFGRDMLSQLLWAIRPTLVMVLIVAAVRLTLGLFIGLGAGWSEGRASHQFDTLISAALAIPGLMIALVAIAAIGVELGIWAFIFGLSITGWAETAQVIREQTRMIKQQAYIEAARACGASNFQIITTHVLRQLAPMIWMLLSFEVSNTLTTTAGLGFLGYYVGGDVWIVVADWVARRASGVPELGQMLATSRIRIDQPWGMVIVGSVIFIMVLGFNLLGEGLRLRLSMDRLSHYSLQAWITDTLFPGLHNRIWIPARNWMRRSPLRAGLIALLGCMLIGAGILWQRSQAGAQQNPALQVAEITVPGGHLWSGPRRDPYGTLAVPVQGPQNPQSRLIFQTPKELTGGPAIAADGTLYLADTDTLYALDPEGKQLWSAPLPVTPTVDTPALAADGTLYLVEKSGGLIAFTPAGKERWRFVPDNPKIASAGPIVGPDGTIYYGYGSNLQAVSPEGKAVWHSPVPPASRTVPPQLTAGGRRLAWRNLLFDSLTGAPLTYEVLDRSDTCITGADGRDYLRSAAIIMQWTATGEDFQILRSATWDNDQFTFLAPKNAGVTADQTAWLFYVSYQNSALVWINMEGKILGIATDDEVTNSQLLALDKDNIGYICGIRSRNNNAICTALSTQSETPLWQTELTPGQIRGGALTAGRLYVALSTGALYSLAD